MDRERRETFDRASKEANEKMGGLEKEQRIPGWLENKNDFLPGDVRIVESAPEETLPEVIVSDILSSSTESESSIFSALEALGLNNVHFGRPEYKSEHARELRELHQRLDMTLARGPQQYDAKQVAYSVLRDTDKAYLEYDSELGEQLYNIAKILTDIATDIIPITSIPKDLYRALIGKEPRTGDVLAYWERVMAASFAALTVTTLGTTTAILPAVRGIVKTGKMGEAEVLSAVKLAQLIETDTKVRYAINEAIKGGVLTSIEHLEDVRQLVPTISKVAHQVSIRRVGNNGKFAVIGKGMDNVKNVREKLKMDGVLAEVFEPTVVSENDWIKALKKYNGQAVPKELVTSTEIYKENQRWIEQKIADGYTILDANNPVGAANGDFYQMELDVIRKSLK